MVSTDGWTTVTLPDSYSSMVVIASPNYDSSSAPAAVRIKNAAGNSFDVMVQNVNTGAAISGVPVHYLVVEEGVYNENDDGVKMEAVKFTSTVTDDNNSWVGEERSYANSYTNPVVIGQVMTANDPDFSTFWARGASRTAPPDSSTLYVGKQVAEDTDNTRADEVIGYLVIEAGNGTIGEQGYAAGLGTDSVRGVGDTPPYSYGISGLQNASTAIVSQAAMDGNNGGWAVLYGSDPVSAGTLQLAIDEDQIGDSERNHTTEQVAYIVFGDLITSSDPYLQEGVVSGVTNTAWTQVTLDHTYNAMVVVASPNYDNSQPPMVVRIQNADGNSFDVRVQRVDGSTDALTNVSVHFLVVEEGVYNTADHGVKMEAVKYTSTVTDSDSSWVGEPRGYSNSYTNPVVLGQVMTNNDADWSVFWARGSSATNPPDSSTLRTGKHVAEDPDTTRADETIGYIVIEAGSGSISGIAYTAALGADSVKGITNGPPFSYSLSGLSSASAAIISSAAMDGGNGGWPVLYGATPVTADTLNLAIDEDQINDSERSHITEQVAYIVFE
jgi:hypothetical protein